MDQGKIVEDNLKNLKRNSLLRQTIALQFFKGCHPQILLGPFLNYFVSNVSNQYDMIFTEIYMKLCYVLWNHNFVIHTSWKIVNKEANFKKQSHSWRRRQRLWSGDLKNQQFNFALAQITGPLPLQIRMGKYLFKVSIKDIGITSMYIPQD